MKWIPSENTETGYTCEGRLNIAMRYGLCQSEVCSPYCEKDSWGIACCWGKNVRYDCDWAIQKNGFAAQVSQMSGKLMEGGWKRVRDRRRQKEWDREVKKNSTVMGKHWLLPACCMESCVIPEIRASEEKNRCRCAWLHLHWIVYAVCVCKCL